MLFEFLNAHRENLPLTYSYPNSLDYLFPSPYVKDVMVYIKHMWRLCLDSHDLRL
jgi:hypothetical protein